MNTAQQIWNWLSGKKTAIGGLYTLTVGFAVANKWIDDVTANYLLGIGGIILGTGIAHKMQKGELTK